MISVERGAAQAAKKTPPQTPQQMFTRCPACEKQNTLKIGNGMVLCTHCFWAIELKEAS